MRAPFGLRYGSLRWLPSAIETMTLAPLHLRTTTSTRAAEASECLRVAGAQAKQEGTGDLRWGLTTQTNLRKASWFRSPTIDPGPYDGISTGVAEQRGWREAHVSGFI